MADNLTSEELVQLYSLVTKFLRSGETHKVEKYDKSLLNLNNSWKITDKCREMLLILERTKELRDKSTNLQSNALRHMS